MQKTLYIIAGFIAGIVLNLLFHAVFATLVCNADPVKADKVRMLFMEYARGQKSLKELRDYSEQIGLYGRRAGRPLTLSIMQKILDNPFYCGIAR